MSKMLTLPEVKTLLERYFAGLSLLKSEAAAGIHTFRYRTFDAAMLEHVKPTVTNNGQVLVYQLGDVGKIGVAPKQSVVRFVDANLRTTEKTYEDRLSKTDLTPEIEEAYAYAVINEGHRLAFMKTLWHYLNKTKFGGRMPEPKLYTSLTCPFSTKSLHTATGVYQGGPAFGAGKLWMNVKTWKARIQFYVETFLHEMCHQATWVLDKSTDMSLGGHGPLWQEWMKRVGLKPDQYDMNDTAEYLVGPIRQLHDVAEEERFGKRVDPSFWSKKHVLTDPTYSGPCWFNRHGRALYGELSHSGKKVVFAYKNPRGHSNSFVYPDRSKWARVWMPSFYTEHPQ